MKTLPEILKEIGYNDSPLRREVINVFKEWLQQKQKEEGKGELYSGYNIIYDYLGGLLKELEQK